MPYVVKATKQVTIMVPWTDWDGI